MSTHDKEMARKRFEMQYMGSDLISLDHYWAAVERNKHRWL